MTGESRAPDARRRLPRPLLWGALVLLLVIAQSLLVALTVRYEDTRAQDKADAEAAVAAAEFRRVFQRGAQTVQATTWNASNVQRWRAAAAEALRGERALLRIERRTASMEMIDELDAPGAPPIFERIGHDELNAALASVCAAARRTSVAWFSTSYFVPLQGGSGAELVDVCVAHAGLMQDGYVVGTLQLGLLLEQSASAEQLRAYEISVVEGDGTRLARAGAARGNAVYRADRIVDLPGLSLRLRVDAVEGRPSLIPNLATALVLGLSLGLAGVVMLLARDVQRRSRAELALAEALAFRQAMEDSLITGLRARDREGRVSYVNPAFCQMVGYTAEELRDAEVPPYWPADRREEYAARQATRRPQDGPVMRRDASPEGVETLFQRKNGERFPVMVYEAPLVDGAGRQTGWMGAVLDISEQRRVEELSRQQQERLQATARLATVGEMASLLSHELNQPLAAIASYANGAMNLLEEPPHEDVAGLLKPAVARIAEQAERAGRVIKSVHDFVRRREQSRESFSVALLVETVLPLARLQARKTGAQIELDVPAPVPRVRADRTMIEQVLLNLVRNGMQAMEPVQPPAARVLTLRVRQLHPRWVTFSVIDRGPGIAPEVAQRLFTPFFTTRAEGMGLGLSLCRTVIEQHGGALDFAPGPAGVGCEFRFTLPSATPPSEPPTPPP